MDDAGLFFAELGLSALSVAFLLFLALLFSSYIRIATALGVLRVGFGYYSLPSAFVTSGLALVLTFFVMYPTLRESGAAADRVLRSRAGPVTDVDRANALNAGVQEWKRFLVKHTSPEERLRFVELARKIDARPEVKKDERPPADLDGAWRVVAPAFLVSELRHAFSIGVTIFLPFLVIDLIVAGVMIALGAEKLQPQAVALPIKLLLFVIADGWMLITSNLVSGFTPPGV